MKSPKKWLEKYPSLPNSGLNEVIIRHFLKQLASALQFLRTRNLVHRDVKPQNLLLLPPRSYREIHKLPILAGSDDSLTPVVGLPSLPMLKLADFGFARVLPSTSLAETLCGSPLYMAPEILRYERYDAKADLWSVGTVLYEMVSGRPPFRASNHVELLRKIESADDLIRFPREVVVTPELKALVRALLKRNPVERMSFENFFANEVVTGPIPGLVEDDVPKPQRRPSLKNIQPPSRTEESIHRVNSERRLSVGRRYVSHQEAPRVPTGSSPKDRRPVSLVSPSEVHSVPRQEAAEGLGIRPPSQASIRTATLQERRRRSSNEPGHTSTPTRRAEGSPRTERVAIEEKAAQDVAFERDYVVIEKKQVEMNAFADEMMAGRKAQASPKSTDLVRRPNRPLSAGPQLITSGGRPVSREGIPGSPTSFITRAIHDASMRLFGSKNPQPFLGRVGTSPPQGFPAFPAYPTPSAPIGLISDGKATTSIDEDTRVAQRIEDYATRSDVAYGFAEVKYKQLVPLAPSIEHGLGGVPTDQMSADDDGLTPEAIVTLSEEALVLYVKSLALLAKAMDIASLWWSRKNRSDAGSNQQILTNGPESTRRINNAVQWIRNRFNEVLEKAEVSRMKLMEAQKQLPEDHPSHPNNHPNDLASASSSAIDVFLTPGITAERLMYERAIEMSRSAAINEVANCDLAGCERSYLTAIRMLEAVLETEEGLSKRKSFSAQKEDKDTHRDDAPTDLGPDDQQNVTNVMKMVTTRLAAVRKKMHLIATAEKAEQQQQYLVRRRSGDVTPRSVRSQASS